jgi:acyl-CoA synthetase (AMP-forming)/AMP-acid ligase II
MTFANLSQPDDAVAAIDARSGAEWTYANLRTDIARIQAALPSLGRKSLGLMLAQNRYECLAVYLAALNAGSALILLDASLNPALLHGFLETYKPDWIFSLRENQDLAGYAPGPSHEPGLLVARHPCDLDIHPDLALLLNTSGSTGSPKLVRLTLANLDANARSIAEYLGLTATDRPITSLPMPYSYGLSVINSHLQAGAAIVFTEDSVLRREFWDAIDRYGCTSFAGVPYTYQLLLQAGLLTKRGASLKTLTQAGGRLDERHIRQMLALSESRGWRFFVMYGQTEATARIAYVPSERLREKVGSVGIAIPNGSLTVDEHTGELIYSGPNVMQGYAESRADLARGDELHGILRTGDIARLDADGYAYITGRLKRFLKLFGKRFNLDEVESIVSRHLAAQVACFGSDDLLQVAIEGANPIDEAREMVCKLFDLPRTAVNVISIAALPRTANGKLDYQALTEAAQPAPAATR